MRLILITLERVLDILESYEGDLPSAVREKVLDELDIVAYSLRDRLDEEDLDYDDRQDH
jgi:hypothetical protein